MSWFILVSCSLGFVFEMYEGNWKFAPLSVNPMLGPNIAALDASGAKDTAKIVNDGQGWRLVSTMFLHAGIFHYLLNMSAVVRMIMDFERDVGSAYRTNAAPHCPCPCCVRLCRVAALRIAILYLCSGVFSTIASAVFIPSMITVGASGGSSRAVCVRVCGCCL